MKSNKANISKNKILPKVDEEAKQKQIESQIRNLFYLFFAWLIFIAGVGFSGSKLLLLWLPSISAALIGYVIWKSNKLHHDSGKIYKSKS